MNDIRLRSNCSPIAHLESLAKQLGIPSDVLQRVAADSESHWRPGRRIPKKDGTTRVTNSATKELKSIHRRINETILRNVHFPHYLFGSLPKSLEAGVRDHVANAKFHAGNRVIITTDIKNYFPSITAEVIHSIWQGFFNFSPEVAGILTTLTSFKGSLPQGWACSSYLAQLVFWRQEPELVRRLSTNGIKYSRLTDDITMSTNRTLKQLEISGLVRRVSRMLGSHGTGIHRDKTQFASRARRQSINNVNVSVRGVSLATEYRKNLRARVHRITTTPEQFGDELGRELHSAKGQISYMRRFHKTDAKRLWSRVKTFENTNL